MSGRKTRGRNAIALTFSAALHVLFLAMVINESATPYQLPEATPPPMEVQIFPPEEIPPPPPPPLVVIPPQFKKELKEANQVPPPPIPPTPQPPKPQPQPPTPVAPQKPAAPKPNPPTPAPPTPVPPTPVPARPAPPKPAPLPAVPVPAKSPAPPAPTPSPSPAPKPSANPSPSTTAPSPAPARITAPTISIRPSLLNLHKPAKEAPANVPTLPMAPSGQAGGGGGQAGGGGGAPAALTGSRLNGLSPYPYGSMPSGGPGLRGTLVGCANAEAVSLSRVERAHCNERFGVEAAKAPALDGIDPGKRSLFDKTAGRQESERNHGNAIPVGTESGDLGMGGLGSPK